MAKRPDSMIITTDDGRTYSVWTVGYVNFYRPDIAERIIKEIERKNPETTCHCDVRIQAFQRLDKRATLLNGDVSTS